VANRTGGGIPFLLTACALVAFAANSVLCRLALGEGAIDAYGFTAVRVGSGAAMLLLLATRFGRRRPAVAGTKRGAFFLLVYALPFSFAYLRLDTGTGALLLFGAVQLTLLGRGIQAGERPGLLEWAGLLGASAGVVYLVSPGVTAPDPVGALFMILAGVGWAGYTIVGKGAGDPQAATSGNFLLAAVVAVPVAAVAWPLLSLSREGVLLAAASGALASGLGYAIWYAALRHLSLTRAALVQLAVPALAAAGGIVFVAESISTRLVIASVVILGSIAAGILGRQRAAAP
jgi:drug/metabolite transporter (DMT)-like permease